MCMRMTGGQAINIEQLMECLRESGACPGDWKWLDELF